MYKARLLSQCIMESRKENINILTDSSNIGDHRDHHRDFVFFLVSSNGNRHLTDAFEEQIPTPDDEYVEELLLQVAEAVSVGILRLLDEMQIGKATMLSILRT